MSAHVCSEVCRLASLEPKSMISRHNMPRSQVSFLDCGGAAIGPAKLASSHSGTSIGGFALVHTCIGGPTWARFCFSLTRAKMNLVIRAILCMVATILKQRPKEALPVFSTSTRARDIHDMQHTCRRASHVSGPTVKSSRRTALLSGRRRAHTQSTTWMEQPFRYASSQLMLMSQNTNRRDQNIAATADSRSLKPGARHLLLEHCLCHQPDEHY